MAAGKTVDKKKQPLTEDQKHELARFVEKINNMVPSEFQQAIFEKAKTQQGRYVVNAGPGSGKTTTAIKASTFFTGRALYLAFNNKIMLDAHHKLTALGAKMTASTMHSFGLSCLQAYTRGKCKVDKEKYDQIINDYLRDAWEPFIMSLDLEAIPPEQQPTQTDAREWSFKLIHYCQLSLTQPTNRGLLSVIEQFELSDINPDAIIWPLVSNLISYALDKGLDQFHTFGTVNFDDMLYYPNIIPEVPVRTYRHIILDEAQDASKAGLHLIMRACNESTQVFAIGDTKQSIYAFAGADIDSIPNIINELSAETLDLRVCYRCGTSIIDLANQLDGHIIPAPGAHTGSVTVINAEDYLRALQPKDVVLARTTKHLVKDCLAVLQTGRRAMVLGKDLGRSIAAIVSRIEEMRVGRGKQGKPALATNLSNFPQLLEEHTAIKKKEISERQNLKNKDLALDELLDRIETVKAFYIAYITKCLDHSTITEHDPACQFNHTAADFKYYIKGLFTDEQDKSIILFMTAHRCKGGEWERVYIIGTHEFPHPKAKSEKQLIQENNLMYVAITRAAHKLYFVEEPFSCLNVPGYEPDTERLTIITAREDHVEIYQPAQEESRHIRETDEEEQPLSFAEMDDYGITSVEEEIILPTTDISSFRHDEIITPAPTEGRVSRALAIEILCPTCGNPCANRITFSTMITEDLTGHVVTCTSCHKESIVPLNAFSLIGEVIAREKPTSSKPNHKIEKKGRAKKERKSAAGRKAKSGVVRQPLQLSLDVRTIEALNFMGINKSELFETLLQQYEPFTNTWSELGNEYHEEEEELMEEE